jgi:NDP-sugar pyrophosphorylase family protein
MQTEGGELQASQVAILCGGRGVRLKPTTDIIPKALVELNGRPILDYVIAFYRAKGFKRFILCVGYRADQVRAHYEDPPPGIQICFSDAGENASMLERVWALREHMGERLFVSYCDTFIDLDLDGLLETHLAHRAEATIVTAKIRNPFGLVTSDPAGWALSFVEKPVLSYYIGCFVLEKSALAYVTPELLQKPDGQGLVNYFGSLIEQRRLATFEHAGVQITFNTEPERRKAEEDLGQFYTYSEAT